MSLITLEDPSVGPHIGGGSVAVDPQAIIAITPIVCAGDLGGIWHELEIQLGGLAGGGKVCVIDTDANRKALGMFRPGTKGISE